MPLDTVSPPGNLETARKAVEDTAAVGAGLWLSYLFVLFYLAVAAGAVTHADLFLEKPVKLPFLNIELPLLAFFSLAPLLFLLTHAYTLVHLVLLANRVAQFNDELEASPEDPVLWHRRLPSNIFVQFLGALEQARYTPFGLLLATILWVTLVVAPIALFLLLQVQFLPYHSRWITWTSRIALALDLGLLWWLWRDILNSRARHADARPWKRVAKLTAGAVLTPAIILFAWGVATFPGEWQETRAPGRSAFAALRELFLYGDVGPFTGQRTRLFASTLVLPFFNTYEALNIDPKKVDWKKYLIDLRGRDLRGAVLYYAVLPRSFLRGAQLEGAVLTNTQLQGSSLVGAHLQGVRLESAQLQEADFSYAELQGASLDYAHLQGAWLYGALLEGASLYSAQLQGAVLNAAWLQGASLDFAQLRGASLYDAQLQAASFDQARLQGALLDHAQLQGASLNGAQLRGASLEGAFVWRARLDWDPSQSKDLFAPNDSLDWTREYELSASRQDWMHKLVEQAISKVDRRNAALERVAILDCTRKSDELASCDRSAEPSSAVKQWKTMIQAATVDQTAYVKALAKILGDLACAGDLAVLHGLLKPAVPSNLPAVPDVTPALRGTSRFAATRSEAPALAKRIMGAQCPVSTMLSQADEREIASMVASATSD
jgi:uncharacterized protein YjbI with pentapeptide repeats